MTSEHYQYILNNSLEGLNERCRPHPCIFELGDGSLGSCVRESSSFLSALISLSLLLGISMVPIRNDSTRPAGASTRLFQLIPSSIPSTHIFETIRHSPHPRTNAFLPHSPIVSAIPLLSLVRICTIFLSSRQKLICPFSSHLASLWV